VPMLIASKSGFRKVKRRMNTVGLMSLSRSPEMCLTPAFPLQSCLLALGRGPLLTSDAWPPCAGRSRRTYGFGVSGLGYSASLALSNCVGDDEFSCLSAPIAGELIASISWLQRQRVRRRSVTRYHRAGHLSTIPVAGRIAVPMAVIALLVIRRPLP
jgi:hypothetical protein